MADDGRPVCDVCGVLLRFEDGTYIQHDHLEIGNTPSGRNTIAPPDLELEVLLLEEKLIEKREELKKAEEVVRRLESEILGREDLHRSVVKILPWYRTIRSQG